MYEEGTSSENLHQTRRCGFTKGMMPMPLYAWIGLGLLALAALSAGCCAPGNANKPQAPARTKADPNARLPLTPEGKLAEAQSSSELTWRGRTWVVKSTIGEAKAGPGPIRWADDNVVVDAEGRLHLKLTQRGGEACGSELVAKEKTHYGRYVWNVYEVKGIRLNEVFGLFVYGDPKDEGVVPVVPEIDIELARWHQKTDDLLQMTCQPWYKPENVTHRPCPTDRPLTFAFSWAADKVSWLVKETEGGKVVTRWSYSGPDLPHDPLTTRMNLWSFDGKMSSPPQAEVVISDFRFTSAKK
jgi:hypothetical protein